METRMRGIKEGLFSSEELYDAEQELGAPFILRLAYAGLPIICDREGRFKWRPRKIKARLFPYDDIDIEAVLNALLNAEMISQYEVDGELFGWMPTFRQHQFINNRERPSKLPPHPLDIDASLTRETRVDDASSTSLFLAQGKGKERKGIRKEENIYIVRDDIQNIFDYWRVTLNHGSAKLDDKRKSKIKKALEMGYTALQLQQAIDGCSKTPHNMGQNDKGEKYDSIDLILRDADHIDRFIRNATNPPKGGHHAYQRVTAASTMLDTVFKLKQAKRFASSP